MSSLETSLGPELLTKEGAKPTTSALADAEVIGIYFSAHWCGPCRHFTPVLAKAYKSMKDAGKKFEVVFVSSDRDATAFEEYYSEMPFLALPYANRDLKNALSKKHKVRGIPTLILLDSEGNILNKNGRSVISSDPEGANFPWAPKSVHELLGSHFLKGSSKVGKEAIEGKTLGLYFSAHWCPPCRGFTPELAKTYEAMKSRGVDDFEIIFVSSDSDEAKFDEYRGEQPWLALPFADRKAKEALSEKFEIEGIPSLVIIGPDGSIINGDARGLVAGDPEGKKYPWVPPLVPDLSDASFIEDSPTLIVMADGFGDKDAAESLRETMIGAATKERDEHADNGVRFALALPGDQLAERIRSLAKLGDAKESASMVILDIPDEGGFYTNSDDVTADAIQKFVDSYRSKALERKQLGN